MTHFGQKYDDLGADLIDVAKVHYNKCLEIQTKIKGPDSIDVATTLNNIGIVYKNKGDYAKALEHYNKCL